MSAPPDVEVGQAFALVEGADRTLFECTRVQADGRLRFERNADGRHPAMKLTPDEFDRMRSDGRLTRVRVLKAASGSEFSDDIDPACFADPDERNISPIEKKKRNAARTRLSIARSLRFYCVRHDELANPPMGAVGLRRMVHGLRDEATKAGLTYVPSPSAIARALKRYGIVGSRPLAAFLTYGLHKPQNRWHPEVLKLRDEMIEHYWSEAWIKPPDAIAFFKRRFRERCGSTDAKSEAPIKQPSVPALKLWIKLSLNRANWARKFGEDSANTRFQGHKPGLSATRPLQVVVFDHTEVDAWAGIFDQDGNRITVVRPTLTLAIDVYSRMILGAALTYEGPSLAAVMECLREVIRMKTFLIDRWGDYKGATDGWGKPGTIVVDNGWEFTGVTFQTVCEAAGISVEWAPVKTPEWKAYVERAFGTLNEALWHKLRCGIPYKPEVMRELRLRPEDHAHDDLDDLRRRVWEVLVTIYHVEVHSTIGMAPARKWARGITRGRPTIDDPRMLDTLIGSVRRAHLSAEGVRFDNQRFNDPVVTSRLLDSLLRFAPVPRQARGKLRRGYVPVVITIDDTNCDFIDVWDPRNKRNERLPNVSARYSRGLSWKTHKKIRAMAEAENLAFHTDEEMFEAREKFYENLGPDLKKEKIRAPGRRAKVAAHHRESMRLVSGDVVLTTTEDASVSGLGSNEIPVSLPAIERKDDRMPPLRARRGGKKATQKAAATRDKKRKAEKAVAGGPSAQTPATKPSRFARSPARDRKAPAGEITPQGSDHDDSLLRLAELEKQLLGG